MIQLITDIRFRVLAPDLQSFQGRYLTLNRYQKHGSLWIGKTFSLGPEEVSSVFEVPGYRPSVRVIREGVVEGRAIVWGESK